MITRHERILEILCVHCSQDLEPVDVEIVPDGRILDLFAARVGGEAEYLVHLDGGYVEEVLFDRWPPSPPGAGVDEYRPDYQTDDRRETSKEKRPMRIEKLMSRDVHFCRPEDSLESCARQMWEQDFGSVPVCSGDGETRVVGMITDRDICMCALHEGKPLSALRVGDAMSRSVTACRPTDDTEKVEQLMRQQQIRRVPVTDGDGELIGIVSLADLARVADASDRKGSSRRSVSESEVGDTLAAIVQPNGNRSAEPPSRSA